MIVASADEFLRAREDLPLPPERPATLRAAMLVTPIGFRVSEQSAADNPFMVRGAAVDLERAHAQHAGLAARLTALGVPVVTVPGRVGLDDAVYPNNVYATIPGRLIIGAMRHPVRRAEADRLDVRKLLRKVFQYEERDLSKLPAIAELTGPLVIDRLRGIGFCGMTSRVDAAGCAAMHDAFDLRLTYRFPLSPGEYHTNLALSILAGRAAVLHAGSFADPQTAAAIARAYAGRALMLSAEEKAAFAANCLAVTDRDILFSATSVRALRAESAATLERWGFRLHGVEVDELEKGGGSLRCLIAEIF